MDFLDMSTVRKNIIFLVVMWNTLSLKAGALDLEAKQAILIDLSTNTVLYEKNADILMTPSSMSKIMLVYDIFERLNDGRLKMDDTFYVSRKAWKMGGSRMFVEPDTHVSVGDLLRGVIVQSGNDASVVFAEGLGGTESAYAAYLTERAHEMGASKATFTNATGWPDANHKMTARDLAIIGAKTIQDFPELYKIYGEQSFTYNKIKQGNRNPLLYDQELGADGMKTGSSDAGGQGLVGTAQQNGRRLLFVINGCTSIKARAQDAKALVRWGFREFDTVTLASKGDVVRKVEVQNGEKRFVDVTAPENLLVTVPIRERKNIKLVFSGEEPLQAPVVMGQLIGRLEVKTHREGVIKTWDAKAAYSVERLSFFGRLWQKIMKMLVG